MTNLPTYTFLPYLRQGVVNTITTADGDASVTTRASTHVELQLDGDPVGGGAELTQTFAQDIALYGPGEIVGIDPRAVVRTEPRNWITNFESNYLAAIDFYDEDLPWRYTPAAADGSHLRLRPWVCLAVLADGEFEEGKDVTGRPLPFITVAKAEVLPKPDELWAWAHVHFNKSLEVTPGEVVSGDTSGVIQNASAAVAANRDVAYSRLMCPRRLRENTTYHAFVVPTFERGRLAGLGQQPSGAPYATASAWSAQAAQLELPVYFRWQFMTGDYGDFEYLVRLLKPQPVDPRVGIREFDVQDPGSNLPPIANLGGILRLGGALQVPDADLDAQQLQERDKFEKWDAPYPDQFEDKLAAFVNLPDDYATKDPDAANTASGVGGGSPDPLITAPLYGRWHALTQRLLTKADGSPADNSSNWVHRLNLDPRFRVPAGFGADIVETNAEEYMDDAWQQIGNVLAANSKIRRLHLGVAVAARWFDQHITPLAAVMPERALALTAPVQRKILNAGTTVNTLRSASFVQPALTATAMRRVLRPTGRLMRLLPFDAVATPANLLARINAGEVEISPPKTPPSGVMTVGQVAAAAQPAGVPAGVGGIVAKYPWLPWALIALGIVLLVILAIVLPFGIGLLIGLVVLGALIALALWLLKVKSEEAPALSIQENDQTPAEVASLPDNPGFTLSAPGAGSSTPTGTTDSPMAVRFKQALGDSYALVDASTKVGRAVPLTALDLVALTSKVVSAVEPSATIPRRGFSSLVVPDWVRENLVEDFGEVMAYPKIDLPMYRPLKDRSVEMFLPNINRIPENSITLVETNQRFIEAYMVGLNHEFARKLLWREYPTDQRGSYFRQFWDVGSVLNSEGLSQNVLKEALYDIPELHRWPPTSGLGDHNNRQTQGETGPQAVLVIRGELLKKYPTAIIYAHRAQWQTKKDGTPDLTKRRELVDLTAAEEDQPPLTKMRFPLYEAKADPDIYFFGFDLTVGEAKGGTGQPPDVDPGWFFVIKQRPGEPRFGLELSEPQTQILEQVTWTDVLATPPAAGAPPQFLPATALSNVPLGNPAPEEQAQHDEDVKANSAPVSAARWAYLLFRAPAMVAVHADEMLRNP